MKDSSLGFSLGIIFFLIPLFGGGKTNQKPRSQSQNEDPPIILVVIVEVFHFLPRLLRKFEVKAIRPS
ncbi:hypothetical protein KAT45_03580, partial [Candidatus Aerophobetes bacterium]|nr:hypothetical protein [Candidatus Aerophobetes bacterium]